MDFLQEGLERLWEGQVELKQVQVEIKDQLQKNQVMVTMDDITDKVHEEVLHIYFDIMKVEQGQGKNLKDKFIMKVEEVERVSYWRASGSTSRPTLCLGCIPLIVDFVCSGWLMFLFRCSSSGSQLWSGSGICLPVHLNRPRNPCQLNSR